MAQRHPNLSSYVSHISAALYWSVPYIHVVWGYQSHEAMVAAQTKTHRCYSNRGSRSSCKSVNAHVNTLKLPKNAVVIKDGEAVASPELVFLDLAPLLSFHQRVLLGMQLCSTVSNTGSPLTTTKRLNKFLLSCKDHKGRALALLALQYVADNSRSIMESLLYMMLSLPHIYGGYGLEGATLNHCLYMRSKPSWQNSNKFYADLYWKEARLVVEYDSIEHHNSSNAWVKDSRRATMLEKNGYKTISINTKQAYNPEALFEAAQAIAKCLAKRIRIRSKRFEDQRILLHNMLPRKEQDL